MAEYFRRTDGTDSSDRADALTTTPKAIAQAWLRWTREIPPQFAVGTALHESSYTVNEHDVEPNGHETGGVFQLDVPSFSSSSGIIVGDANAAGMLEKDVYTLDDACAIFASRCSSYLRRIISAAKLDAGNLPPDVWAYVAIAHNQGIGAALKSIQQYGLDWSAYKARNAGQVNIATDRGNGVYGDDVITGGPDWEDSYASPFDDTGAPIPAPTVDAATSTKIRLGLLALLVLLVALSLLQPRSPLKGIL